MNRNSFWSFLLLFTILIPCNASSKETIITIQIDSLRRAYTQKSGVDKISAQLELTLRVMLRDKNEALTLSTSALLAAKSMKNRSLEMRSYYTLGRISQELENMNLSEAYYDSSLTIAEASGDNWYKGEILYYKGRIRNSNRDELKALEYFNASLQAGRLSNNFKIMGSSYSLMGTIFRMNGLYDRAIEYIINSKLNYEKAGFSEGNAWAAYLLGRIYNDLKLPQRALEYFQEALEIYTKLASADGNNDGLGICFEQIGLLKMELGNYKDAHKYIEQTLNIFAESKSTFGLSNSHKNLGMIEYHMGNYELAEKYLNESLKAKKENGDLLSLPTIYAYLGLCSIGKGNKAVGFSKLQQGLTLAIANNQKKVQLNIYSELTKAYLSNHDLDNAISCQEQQIKIQNLLLSGSANIKIEQLQTIYEIDKKNGQIAELEKQNEINSLKIKQNRFSQLLMISGIFIALLISITVYWLYNEIRLKNRELKESNAAKDKFFAIIAHDLRGPIGTFTSFLEHLNNSFNDHSHEEMKDILRMLYKSAENVNGLIENLLIWAQSQLNKIEFKPSKLNLTEVLYTSTKGIKQIADKKQIDISFELDDQIFVLADANMVQTIVRNIVSNAIKFTNRGGSVIIRSAVINSNTATISIIDNGIGIDKTALAKIFDLNNTLHRSGTEDEKSTGLGLILVKDFIEKNNGTISIESQTGKGTIVSFTLPKLSDSNSPKSFSI